VSARQRGTLCNVALRHELLDTHPRAMRRLRELRDQPIDDAGEGLVALLEHPARDLRIDAARALGEARWRPAVPALIERLHDPHPWVVAWAADALGKIGDKDAVPALSAVLERADTASRVWATTALGRINHRTAVPSLLAALEDPKREVFTQSRYALERLVQPEDRQALEQVVSRIGRCRRRKLRAVIAVLEERERASLPLHRP
jgi:HEAT repeat protein